jgi:hypothetical protein
MANNGEAEQKPLKEGLFLAFDADHVYFLPTDTPKAKIKELRELLLEQGFINPGFLISAEERLRIPAEDFYDLLSSGVTIVPCKK